MGAVSSGGGIPNYPEPIRSHIDVGRIRVGLLSSRIVVPIAMTIISIA